MFPCMLKCESLLNFSDAFGACGTSLAHNEMKTESKMNMCLIHPLLFDRTNAIAFTRVSCISIGRTLEIKLDDMH